MKTLATALLILSALTTRGQIVDIYRNPAQKTEVQQDSALRHVVLFKFREGIPADTLQQIERAFYSLPGKIPEIRDFEWGLNNSPEGLNKGFTHCFLLTFASEADRAVYLPPSGPQGLGGHDCPLAGRRTGSGLLGGRTEREKISRDTPCQASETKAYTALGALRSSWFIRFTNPGPS